MPAAACSPRDARVGGHIQLGGRAAHVPQSTAAAFTPTRHLRGQLDEILAAADAAARAADASPARPQPTVAELCSEVGLDPDLVERYPHQLSGGQLRRAAIAAALATSPAVLLADEPTAGLDPAPALAILRLLRRLADDRGIAVIVFTHDLTALADSAVADDMATLRDGRLGYRGPAQSLLTVPEHPYTRDLATVVP